MGAGRDVHSLVDFKKNTPDFLKKLKETGTPIVLTANGKSELVVQDAVAYQKLLDALEDAKVAEGIRRGLEDVAAGRLSSLNEFEAHVKSTHGITI
ncbi:type II toxin-antitoxin system Phd/YefM family antitoxin [Isosphaeraceae bacterium EP7]